MIPPSLFDQLTAQLRAAGESYSVDKVPEFGARVELYRYAETPKPFWLFDKDNNIIATNQ